MKRCPDDAEVRIVALRSNEDNIREKVAVKRGIQFPTPLEDVVSDDKATYRDRPRPTSTCPFQIFSSSEFAEFTTRREVKMQKVTTCLYV